MQIGNILPEARGVQCTVTSKVKWGSWVMLGPSELSSFGIRQPWRAKGLAQMQVQIECDYF